ncbi:MAG: hypothetical protein ACLQIB_49375 [Isosphaeraceae bacterium]
MDSLRCNNGASDPSLFPPLVVVITLRVMECLTRSVRTTMVITLRVRTTVRSFERLAMVVMLSLAASILALSAARAARSDDPQPVPPARPRPFRIQVVDDETGWGVPLVELRTVNHIRFVTDSNGIAAFDEPGLFNRKVFFTVKSHGHEFEKDGFGYRGKALEITEGGTARLTIRRQNVARRLYRVTGQGIYRDSVLCGDKVPIREPLLNGQVFGQDSVVNAVFRGKIYWFWGDTNRPDYPLGNFHVPGATSELPDHGGLDPGTGVNLTYFVDNRGFARPTAPMPGEGPTWISGLVVLKDKEERERMFAVYAKVRKMLEVYERGLAEFNPDTQQFDKVRQFPEAAKYPGEHPDGHAFFYKDHGIDYVYYASPYPLVRVPADPDQLKTVGACEAFSCLKAGTRVAQQQLDRDARGVLHYGWKPLTQAVRQEQQSQLISKQLIRADEGLLNLRDVETGKTVIAHGGSVNWNAYRKRWVMIAVESFGSSSALGEIWFAEADTPLGPWTYARKIVSHDRYSFYNPKQHPMFDKDGGRLIFFEGTYTTTFSGNLDPTPRYDYNQIMYQLDLSDRRLALPVAIYEVPRGPGGSFRLQTRSSLADLEAMPPPRLAFFAPDRQGIAWLPVYERDDPNEGWSLRVATNGAASQPAGAQPLFFILPADIKDYTSATVPLYEYRSYGNGQHYYSIDAPTPNARAAPRPRVLGRVWRNPSRLRLW